MFTTYLKAKILKHLVGLETLTPPTTFALGLHTSAGEVTGGGYARQTVSFNSAVRSVEGGTSVRNTNRLVFPDPTAEWGMIETFKVYDGTGAGANALVEGAVDPNILISNGDDPFIVEIEQLWLMLGPDGWSQDCEQRVLDLVFAGGSYQPADLYCALIDNAPGFDSTESEIDEPAGGGYARIQYGTGGTKWEYSGSAASKDDADFAEATEDWETRINGGALLGASSGGILIGWGMDPLNLQINEGDSATFPESGMWMGLS